MKRNLLKTMLAAVIVLLGAMNVSAQDYTDKIVNADLTGTDGWNTEGTKGYHSVGGVVTCGNNAQFDFKQTIENLPAGQYKLTAQAAYRYSGSEADEAAAIAAGTETKFASLYATVGSKTASTLVQNRYDGASDTDYANGNGSVSVNGKYVPNSTAAVKAWFTAGQYVNEVVFDLPKDGNVTIGIVKTAQPEPGDYTVIGPWTLTRIGDVEVEPDFTSFIVNAGFEDSEAVNESLATADAPQGVDYATTGWQFISSAAWCNSAIFAYGSEAQLNSAAVPAADNAGNAGKALGITVGWSGAVTYQSTEPVTLPVGVYTLSAYVYNANPSAQQMKSLLGFVPTGGEAIVSSTASYPSGEWTLDKVTFTLNTDTEGRFQIGGQAVSGGSGSNAKIFIDNLALSFTDILAGSKAELQAEIDAAEAMLTTFADFTEGRDIFTAAIEAAKNALATATTKEELEKAKDDLKDAETAFREANMFSNQKYIIQNIASEKYWGAGNGWGTQATLVDNAEYVQLIPLPNGKYNMESQVNNGGTSYYFNGDFMDQTPPVELTITKAGLLGYSDEEETIPVYAYTIANGDNYYGWDGTSTVLGKNLAADSDNALWIIVSLDEAKAALAEATVEDPMDATFLIEDHDFGRNNRNADKWTMEASNKNLSGGNNTNNCAESYHSTFTLSQVLADAPAGIYAMTAQGFYRHDEGDNENLPYFYANDEQSNFPIMETLPDHDGNGWNSMSDASVEFANGKYTIEPIIVKVEEGGTLTIGAKLEENTGLWCIWDNFVLTYYGANATIDQVKNAAILAEMQELKAKAEELAKDMENATVKAALDAAVAKAAAAEGADAINAAIADLKAAIESAETVNIAKNVLSKMQQLVESTNVYTQEAYDEYYGQWYQKYEAGTLTKAEAAALQDPFVVTGWHASITCDNFLLSAWDTNPDFNEAPYYINTWSVEGENDGTNFKVPFFEYWTGDDNSLGERTLTATMNGLEKGVYNVNAWVRVRTKNEAGADVEAYGISLQANEGEAVDVTKGDTKVALDKNNNFFLKEVSAKGDVAEDGVLKIKFIVAADNNISWLSFKNVMFEFDAEATGITTIATEKIAADGIFNLAGQKVRNAQKGLYIINGKKVVK